MQGFIVVHFFLLSYVVLRATSSLTRSTTPVSPIRISTYNLRYDSQPDAITVQQSLASLSDPLAPVSYLAKKGEQPWSTRRIKVAEHLLHAGVVMASEYFGIIVLLSFDHKHFKVFKRPWCAR